MERLLARVDKGNLDWVGVSDINVEWFTYGFAYGNREVISRRDNEKKNIEFCHLLVSKGSKDSND